MRGDDNVSRDEVLFVQLISMFQVAAMQQMGKLPNPMTNKVEKDMDQAKMSVDILGMLKEKSQGNLSEREEEFLKTALFEAQMNYLDELKRSEKEEKGNEDKKETDTPDNNDDTDSPGGQETENETEKGSGE